MLASQPPQAHVAPPPRAVQPSFHDVTPRPASYPELAQPRPRVPSFSDQSGSHSIPGAIPGDPTYAPLESNVDGLVFERPRSGRRLGISIALALVAAIIGFAAVLFFKRGPAPVKTPASDPTGTRAPVVVTPRPAEPAKGQPAPPIVATVSAPPSATVIRFEDLPVTPPPQRAPVRARDAGGGAAATAVVSPAATAPADPAPVQPDDPTPR
jgi:hypothetical protein